MLKYSNYSSGFAMVTPVNEGKRDFRYFSIIFGTSDGYLNTAPPKDQHKTVHKSRAYVANNESLFTATISKTIGHES